jgi:hypothetical protein
MVLLQGKTALAMAALRRLGEDIEVALYELSFGTVRRSLRKQVILELRRNATRLGSFDSRLLEITKFFEVIVLLIFVGCHTCFCVVSLINHTDAQ